MDDSAVRLVAVRLAAEDPTAVARFWAGILRWEAGAPDHDGAVLLQPSDGTRFPLLVEPVPPGGTWGRKRLHVDVRTTSVEEQRASAEQALALGGRHHDVGQGPDADHVVLADPEGNELCLVEPWNRFLGDTPRLGCLSCDGHRAVGVFWSAALGWPLVWDQDEETAVQDPRGDGPKISWGGPPVNPKPGPNRLRLHVAPAGGGDQATAVEALLALGARRSPLPEEEGRVLLEDPDGNELAVVTGP